MYEVYTQQYFNVATLPIVLGSLLFYFIPTIIVFIRKVENKAGVVLLNLFLGWTIIGWIIALIMALSLQTKKRPKPENNNM